MPTIRHPINRPPKVKITPEVIAAWKACDGDALHDLLRLQTFDSSPLPKEITALGVSEDDPRIFELQRKLLEVAGWPDCRRAYEENLRDAEEWRDYCAKVIVHPLMGGQGTGCDPASRRRSLEEAETEVTYRRALLEGLD
jgi:hypothetical protein